MAPRLRERVALVGSRAFGRLLAAQPEQGSRQWARAAWRELRAQPPAVFEPEQVQPKAPSFAPVWLPRGQGPVNWPAGVAIVRDFLENRTRLLLPRLRP